MDDVSRDCPHFIRKTDMIFLWIINNIQNIAQGIITVIAMS
jgi:hypothetical protein